MKAMPYFHFARLILAFLVASFCFMALSNPSFAHDDEKETVSISPQSRNQIIKLTDKGPVPASLSMKKEDSIVFFVNDTNDSLTTLEIDFGDKPMHCGGGNLRAMDDGKTKSVRPFGPSDFATTCFHEPGHYKFTVFGLKANPKGIQSIIHVE